MSIELKKFQQVFTAGIKSGKPDESDAWKVINY
jgi:hypothetical protein